MKRTDRTLLNLICTIAAERGFDPWDFDIKAFKAELKNTAPGSDAFIAIMKKYVVAAEARHKVAA